MSDRKQRTGGQRWESSWHLGRNVGWGKRVTWDNRTIVPLWLVLGGWVKGFSDTGGGKAGRFGGWVEEV